MTTPKQVVVVEPTERVAGVAVTRDLGRAPGSSLTVDQIHADGTAEAVYVGEEHGLELIAAIAEALDEGEDDG